MPPQTAAIHASSAAGKAGNNGGDNEHRDQGNPEQSRADEDEQHDRGEKADDQHEEREAERADSADIDAMRAVCLRVAIGRRRPSWFTATWSADAVRRDDLRLCARPLRLVWILRHDVIASCSMCENLSRCPPTRSQEASCRRNALPALISASA